MPTDYIVDLLVAERDRLSRAIDALQGPTRRRGRPPKNPLAASSAPAPATQAKPARKNRTFTAAQRKQQAARMKAYWANKRKLNA